MKQLEDQLDSCLENSGKNFWEDYNKKYYTELYNEFKSLKEYLTKKFDLTEEQAIEYIKEIESGLYKKMKTKIPIRIKETRAIVEYFKKKFWYEKEGEVKNWNRYKEEEIDNSFKENRALYMELYDQMKTYSLISNQLIDINTINNTEELNAKIEEILKDSKNFEPFLKQNEIYAYKKKFENAATAILEDAKRRKEGLNINNLPYWFYGLLVFFGYDDFFRWIKNIYILIPMLLVGIASGLIIMFDTNSKVKNFYFDTSEKIFKIQKNVVNFIKKKLDRF